eukprot:scaffold12564_cov60-Attheya_sp.AAC.9
MTTSTTAHAADTTSSTATDTHTNTATGTDSNTGTGTAAVTAAVTVTGTVNGTGTGTGTGTVAVTAGETSNLSRNNEWERIRGYDSNRRVASRSTRPTTTSMRKDKGGRLPTSDEDSRSGSHVHVHVHHSRHGTIQNPNHGGQFARLLSVRGPRVIVIIVIFQNVGFS